MMRRSGFVGTSFLYAALLGIVGAGIVHIVIVLMLPSFSERDIWSRLSAVAAPYSTVRLDRETLAGSGTTSSNPFIAAAACRFDLANGTLHVRADGMVPFWSMSIYDSSGLNVFSISDRAAANRMLDFVVLSPAQVPQLQSELPPEFERSLFVETDIEEGIVLVRVFVPDETWEDVTGEFLDGLECAPS